MRILIHDFGSYSFPVQLARRLARDGHEIFYLHSDFYETKGAVTPRSGDPRSITFHTVSLGEPYARYKFGHRAIQDWRYAGLLAQYAADAGVEVVVSANTPLIAAHRLSRACRRNGIRYVHWAQDLHTLAIRSILGRRNRIAGFVAGRIFGAMERGVFGRADACIVIAGSFLEEMKSLGIGCRRHAVIPNWMPLDEMVPQTKDNEWSRRHNLQGTVNLMYVGTLSLKHDSEPFLMLARHFRKRPDVRIVVVSAGAAFDDLKAQKERQELDNLILLGWQRYEELSLVFGAADVLFATVSADGSRFSVPCKVLSYASAARPVLAHMPPDNLVARIVQENRFGRTVRSDDLQALCDTAEEMVREKGGREEMGRNARAYAEATFDIDRIAAQFVDILSADPTADTRAFANSPAA